MYWKQIKFALLAGIAALASCHSSTNKKENAKAFYGRIPLKLL